MKKLAVPPGKRTTPRTYLLDDATREKGFPAERKTEVIVVVSPLQATDSQTALHPLIAVVGPTGASKSALAMHLAGIWRAEIVNCDSLQVYRHFDIGTAKSPPEERQAIPHHLFDILDPDQLFTAGEYAREGRRVLAEIASRGNVPVVVGGTGFYLRALLDGLFEGPQRDEALRRRLTDRSRAGLLHRYLRRLDPQAAKRIHPNDRNKLIRAIEICLLTRMPVTDLHAGGSEPLHGFKVCLIGLDPPRDVLYQMLNTRCKKMWESGLVAEIQRIIALGYTQNCKPFESLGYKQALHYIDGKMSAQQALEEMQMETRRYAKRQWTWFKKDTRVSWIPGFGHSQEVIDRTREIIEDQLTSVTSFLLPRDSGF